MRHEHPVSFPPAPEFYQCRPRSAGIVNDARSTACLCPTEKSSDGRCRPHVPHQAPIRPTRPQLGAKTSTVVTDSRAVCLARCWTVGKLRRSAMRMRSVLSNRPGSVLDAGAPGPDLSRRFALSEAEAALFLGMSRAWLKKARTSRFRAAMDAPPCVKAGARGVVYRRRDLEDWEQAHVSRRNETTRQPEMRSPAPHP